MRKIEAVVQDGVIRPGDVLLTSKGYVRVFRVLSSQGESVSEGEPGQIVQLVGPGDLVSSQESLVKVKNEAQGRAWREL